MSAARTPAGSAVPPLSRAGLTDRPWYREARAIGRVYGRNRPAVVGAVLLLGFGLVAALAPLIAPADPFLPATTREGVFNPPSWDHLAGTDALGRDVLSRTIFGARIAWQIVLVAIGVAVGIGVPLGLLAGYVGGKLDELVIMRFVDAVMALPGLVLIRCPHGRRRAQHHQYDDHHRDRLVARLRAPDAGRGTADLGRRSTSTPPARSARPRPGSCGAICCPT